MPLDLLRQLEYIARMSGPGKGKDGATGKTAGPSGREARLAEALRRNLRRRKAQARRRKTETGTGQDDAPEQR